MSAVKRNEAATRYRDFVEMAMGKELVNPLQKVYGGMILGGKMFMRGALERVKSKRLKSPETSHRKAMHSDLEIEDIISVCCEQFDVTREELIGDRSGVPRKACIDLARKYTPATNRDIAGEFGTLTYSGVAKVSDSMAKQLLVNQELRRHIDRVKAECSFFKVPYLQCCQI